jgi:hypothetical protein
VVEEDAHPLVRIAVTHASASAGNICGTRRRADLQPCASEMKSNEDSRTERSSSLDGLRRSFVAVARRQDALGTKEDITLKSVRTDLGYFGTELISHSAHGTSSRLRATAAVESAKLTAADIQSILEAAIS